MTARRFIPLYPLKVKSQIKVTPHIMNLYDFLLHLKDSYIPQHKRIAFIKIICLRESFYDGIQLNYNEMSLQCTAIRLRTNKHLIKRISVNN